MSKFAIVFPGQGSQSIGMLAELSAEYPIILDTFARASKVLGYDLWALVQQGPIEQLNQTDKTQPALLTASYALWLVWQERQLPAPDYLAGHSLGEYSALVCAGVIEFEQAIKLVELRGQLMQQAVPAGIGAMSAIIGLDDEAIAKACEQAAQDQVVSPVNFNSPGQVVIAGHKEAVERAGSLCKEFGAKRALPLPVSVPSHCALMKPAADALAVALADIDFHCPDLPVINNVAVRFETDAEAIKAALVQQLYSPVRWTETVLALSEFGVSELVEMGPGKVLTGLTKRIVADLGAMSVNDIASIHAVSERLSAQAH